ncbi:MAG TPA: DUF6624 domain-containing protein [Patescibacteria group bacterium]|nr:DUF6624 domain-containing protein [Patescibacteria group bacterium]
MRNGILKRQEIAQELVQMGLADQEMRTKHFEKKIAGSWDENLALRNVQRLKEIIQEIGWPTINKVGSEASWAAWLIVQHADHDPQFQKECLNLIEMAFQRKDVHPVNLAFLTDRVAKNFGQEQTYGTNRKALIKDPDYLDDRRRSIGLLPSNFEQKLAEGKATPEDIERYHSIKAQPKIGPFLILTFY